MSGLRATWLIARREATERARSKAFLASTIVTVLLLGAVVTVVVITDTGPPSYNIALVGESPSGLTAALNAAAVASDALIDFSDLADPEAIADAIDVGKIDGAIVDADTILLGNSSTGGLQRILEAGLGQSLLVERLESTGLDPALLASIL
jgi:ABC-2 type transport system permease protein